VSQPVWAQAEAELTAEDYSRVAQELEKEGLATKLPQARVMLEKVAGEMRDLADQLPPSENEAPADCAPKKSWLQKIGRGVGRTATWLSVQTMKPFVKAGAFATGFFEKTDKNQEVVALYKFFLNNSEVFDELHKEAGTPEEYAELLIIEFQALVEKKSNIILRDTLKSLNLGVEIPENIADLDWSQVDLKKLDPKNIDPKLINEHPEYQDLRPLLGDFTREQIAEVFMSASFDPEINLPSLQAALPKIHELAGGMIGQILVPQIVLAKISGSLAGLYAVPVLAADVGLGVSIAVCLNKNTQAKFDQDADLRQFCSTATNWSSYQIMKSRASGYVSGKNAKKRLLEWNKKRKEHKEARRQARLARRANN
jgi:hypothetical protein